MLIGRADDGVQLYYGRRLQKGTVQLSASLPDFVLMYMNDDLASAPLSFLLGFQPMHVSVGPRNPPARIQLFYSPLSRYTLFTSRFLLHLFPLQIMPNFSHLFYSKCFLKSYRGTPWESSNTVGHGWHLTLNLYSFSRAPMPPCLLRWKCQWTSLRRWNLNVDRVMRDLPCWGGLGTSWLHRVSHGEWVCK